MTRRKLSDVLRQEVTKDAVESEPKVMVQVPDAAKVTSTTSRTRKSSPTSENQIAQLQELKAALAQGAEQEKALLAQIKTLEAGGVRQQQRMDDLLDAQVAQIAQLKTDLTEAKEVILQLSAVNTQMGKTLDELKNPPQPQAKAALAKALPKTPLAVRPLPRHSLQPRSPENAKPPKTVDVGWMD